MQIDGERKAVVDVYHNPGGSTPDQSVSLLKAGKEYPSFESFDRIPVKQLTQVRRDSLKTDVLSVLERNRVVMSEEAKSWWCSLLNANYEEEDIPLGDVDVTSL